MKQNTYYRYRAFNANTLDSLCQDTLYFSNPGSFNDPLDCKPTLESDSSNEELRTLLVFFVTRRVKNEILNNLKQAKIIGESANNHAVSCAHSESTRELQNIAYHSTNPDYEVEVVEAESRLLLVAIERELLKYYEHGVCCFSKSYSNPLLWSHYGDQHKGICIAYGIERNPIPKLSEVVYGGDRSIKTSTLINAFVGNEEQAKVELDRDVLLRKASGWKYENEWRLIGKKGIQESQLLLKEVIFGLRCTNSIVHSVVNALKGRDNKTKFFTMYEIRGSYKLDRDPVDVDDLGAYLPNTARSGIEIFGPVISDDGERQNKV
ncbi:MAG: DUF2971 domain-containing protein [Proteobacteria bacterium]|nr:DUF2971 domain-containing protein [Pseudomonadota bacterium]